VQVDKSDARQCPGLLLIASGRVKTLVKPQELQSNYFKKFFNKSNSPSRNALHKHILTPEGRTVKSFGEINALVKSLQVIVGSVSVHQTKMPRYSSKTLITVLSERSSVCQLLHAASPEQRLSASLRLKTLLLTRGDDRHGSRWKASVPLA